MAPLTFSSFLLHCLEHYWFYIFQGKMTHKLMLCPIVVCLLFSTWLQGHHSSSIGCRSGSATTVRGATRLDVTTLDSCLSPVPGRTTQRAYLAGKSGFLAVSVMDCSQYQLQKEAYVGLWLSYRCTERIARMG